nr:uncharacterized protein CI109_000307 [Kwoniella shandongensis]KAA5531466.1 hypothetical protein CI109_000307 [Kwoniella shandongensis]
MSSPTSLPAAASPSPAPTSMDQEINLVDLTETECDRKTLPSSPLSGGNVISPSFPSTRWSLLQPAQATPRATSMTHSFPTLTSPNSDSPSDHGKLSKNEAHTSQPSLSLISNKDITLSPTLSVRSSTSRSSSNRLSANAPPFQLKPRAKSMTVKSSTSPPSFFSDTPISVTSPEVEKTIYDGTEIVEGVGIENLMSELTLTTPPKMSKALETISPPVDTKSESKRKRDDEDTEGDHTKKREVHEAETTPTEVPPIAQVKPSHTGIGKATAPRQNKADILRLYSVAIPNDSDAKSSFPSFPFFSFSTQPVNIPLPPSPTLSAQNQLEADESATGSPKHSPVSPAPQVELGEVGYLDADKTLVTTTSVVDNAKKSGMLAITGQSNIAPLREALAELNQLRQLWVELDNAHGRFHGGLEEAMERVHQSVTRHVCTDPTIHRLLQTEPDFQLGDLYQARISALQEENHSLRSDVGKTRQANETLSRDSTFLQETVAKKEEEVAEIRKAADMYKSQADKLLIDKEELEDKSDELERENRRWKQRDAKLARNFLDLQEEYEKKRIREVKHSDDEEPSFAVILLEGDASMFDPTLLGRGRRGGEETARRVLEKTDVLAELIMPGNKPTVMLIQLFMDVVGSIESFAKFRLFCDGFNSQHELCAVIDVEGPDGPSDKIKALMSLYVSSDACKIILIGAEAAKRYFTYLRLCQRDGKADKFYAVRSTRDFEDDPFSFLGKDKLLYIEGLFPIDPMLWEERYQASRSLKVTSDISTVASTNPDRPASVASTRTARPPSPLESGSYTISDRRTIDNNRGRKPYSPSDRATAISPTPTEGPYQPRIYHRDELLGLRGTSRNVSSDRPQPPWLRVGSAIDGLDQVETDDERVNRLLEERSMYTNRRGRRSPAPVSPAETPKASRAPQRGMFSRSSTPDTPTGGRQHTIVVPIDVTVDGSIGGSPPESDEDEPSVQLPHSAVKHVQRPTMIKARDENDGMDRQHSSPPPSTSRSTSRAESSISGGSRRLSWKERASQQIRRYPISANDRINQYIGPVSSTNAIPLGSVSSPSARYSELGSGDRLYGFRVAGGQNLKVKRESGEYR